MKSSLKEGISLLKQPLRLKTIWLETSTLAKSKPALSLVVNPIFFIYIRKNDQELADFEKSGFPKTGAATVGHNKLDFNPVCEFIFLNIFIKC